ncbi:MAG: TlyA family RNA methyltransferase [Acidimicrobiaceae bacterium]|nr:TlyA family RNA methyltransferase [Acidimicrobiaceae bacterium]
MSTRRRLDLELVRRQLVSGRTAAREMIGAGRVTVDGAPATKASRMVSAGEAVVVAGPPQRFVSRGGRKLEAALAGFGLDPDGMRAIDVGSSTGGFTDCLLQHGAASVVALDVGRGQLHQRLRVDLRVDVHERTNVRGIDGASVGAPFDLLVSDLSFISLRTVMADLVGLVPDGAPLVLLVKPQFEAGKAEVDRGSGVIRDRAVWEQVLIEVERSVRAHGAAIIGGMASPITGADGNVEFLLHVVAGAAGTTPIGVFDPTALVASESSVADGVGA